MITENTEIVKMVKNGIIRKQATFAVNQDGTYRQINADGMSALTNDFADMFLTLISKGWKLVA